MLLLFYLRIPLIGEDVKIFPFSKTEINFHTVPDCFGKDTTLFFGEGAFYIVIGRRAQANRGWNDGRILDF